MARKFNIGRQSDVTLNKELYDLLMALRYFNNGANEPIQDKQSPIPIGAIWNDRSQGQNILKVNKNNGEWDPAFKGYYHPANLRVKPLNPTNGQMFIDESKDNTLFMYDENTTSWIAVKAATTTSNNILVDMHNNFMHMTPLKDMDSIENQKTYLVPYEYSGKLFDNGVYIHPGDSKYEPASEVSVTYQTSSTDNFESWVHVNPNKLFKIEKRLIKINKTGANAYKVYGTFDSNTEFYYLDSNNLGNIMLPMRTGSTNFDYTSFDKGIEIVSSRAKAADYIYTLSYVFYDTAKAGKLIRKDFTTGSQTQVYVGQLTKKPIIFLDGLYLEQSKYDYDSLTGNIDINDTVINPMDMMAVIFEDVESSGEKTINNITGPGTDTKVGTFVNAQNFIKPLAFVSGVMGTNIVSPEEISFDGDTLIIKNFGPGVSDPVKVMIVEANNMYLSHGSIDSTNTIKHEDITSNPEDEYLVFIDGLLLSSRDIDVFEGEIRIANAIEGQQFVLLKIQDNATTALSFDSKIMNFTLAIKNEDGTLYNECNNACIYVDGKLVPMEDSLYKSELPIKGATGQIVKVKATNSDSIYNYYIWNEDNAKWDKITETSLINTIDTLTKATYSSGSIMLDSTGLENKNGTYYAYTFANGVEEPLLKGQRNIVSGVNQYAVNVEHGFTSGQGAFSAYLDGILCPSIVEESSNTGKFIVPDLIADEGTDPYEATLTYYIERPEKTELVSCERELLTAANRNTEYDNAYSTSISLLPGVVNIYVNGVRLEKTEYSIIDANTFILHRNIVGSQKNYKADDKSTWNKYLVYTKNEQLEIECYRDDEILVEVRQDYNLKTQTIPVRYSGQRAFYMEDDGLPQSLILTQDIVKIYIDGVLYDGEYIINRDSGSIVLLDTQLESIMNIDPIARHFDLYPEDHDEYIREHGAAYIAKPQTNRITFEWR